MYNKNNIEVSSQAQFHREAVCDNESAELNTLYRRMNLFIIIRFLFCFYHQLFEANTNPTDVKDIEFPIPVYARLIRVVPKNVHNKPAMRMEVLGYYTSKYNHIEYQKYIMPSPILVMENPKQYACPQVFFSDINHDRINPI